jgi:hypothetical protein
MSQHTQQHRPTRSIHLHPPNPRRDSSPTPQILARLTTLRAKIASIRVDVAIRDYFQAVEKTGQYYCTWCTPRDFTAGTCGPTCTLLRPLDKSSSSPYYGRMTPDWVRDAHADKVTYHKLVAAMNHFGNAIPLELLSRMEKVAEKLRLKARNWSEYHAETGWKDIPPMLAEGAVFKAYWTIEKGWGKGAEEVEEVPPEVKVVRRVRVLREKVERRRVERKVKRRQTRSSDLKKADEDG